MMANRSSRALVFLTSYPMDVRIGSGVVRMIQGFCSGLKQLGQRCAVHHPAAAPEGLVPFARRRLRFNRTLAAGDYAPFDFILASDFDGYRLPAYFNEKKAALNAGLLADIVRFESGMPGKILSYFAELEAQNVARARMVIVPSRYSKQRIMQYYGVPETKVSVVPLGIDVDAWRRRCNQTTKRENKPFTVLCTARQYRRKGVADLIRAVSLAARKIPDIRLEIVGGGPEEANNRALAAALHLKQAVRFNGDIGDTDRLTAFYRNADLFCMPSYHETFGIVFLEAMACNLPVVAYRSTAVPEVVGEAGAFLVEPGDIDGLADAIVTMAGDASLRARAIKKGGERIEAFRWRRLSETLLQQLDAMCYQKTSEMPE